MIEESKKLEERILELEEDLINSKAAIEQLRVLNEIALSAGRTSNIDETLNLVLNRTVKVVNAEHGAILLISEDQKNVLKTFIRRDDTSKVKENYHISGDITGWVLFNKMSLIIKDLSSDVRFKSTEEERAIIKSLICSPIWVEGRVIGILQMINKKNGESFTSNDLTLFSIISVQTGQLIKNIEMLQMNYKREKEAEIARMETLKLQELDALKTNFFNDISHEFRTPLTLILGPAEKIIDRASDEKIIKEAKVIKQYSNRLLQLINQLLDLSKLEAGKLKIEASKSNIISFIKGIVLSFESLAEDKDINLRFISEKEFIEIYFDKDKVTKIITNLLSNAFKFTPEDGRITISIKEVDSGVEITIKDTGIGIPEEELSKLFDRFYQVNDSFIKEQKGTGIGLALTKELVELHHGKIRVESKESKGTEFTIIFPSGKEHLKADEIIIEKEFELKIPESSILSTSINTQELTIKKSDNKNIILIVEDNYDMRKFISDYLQENYRVEEAITGEQGVRKAEKIIPDLIISDMMMPKMDGNELTRILKNDERTSHIPIILLTAKAAFENKLEGLKTGADEYITKPFDIKELLIRIENLINTRKKLQEKYSRVESISKVKGTNLIQHIDSLRRIDREFLERVIKVIEENIADENFSIEDLGSKVGMSRTQLHRKVKALTGKSPSLYLRSIRLLKAKEMIKDDKGNISEIAYSVGFSTVAYFSTCFKEEFGFTPSELLP